MNKMLTGAVIDESTIIGDGVEVGHNAVILSGVIQGEITHISDGVVVGSNSTIYKGITVGSNAMILPGSVVKQSVPPLAIVEGNPAKIVGYVGTSKSKIQNAPGIVPQAIGLVGTEVKGVTLHTLPKILDLRGNLSVGEFERQIPFSVKRYFIVYDVPTADVRGEHAHISCHQFLLAVRGSVQVIADDGENRAEFTLDQPNVGIYLPPMVWGIQYQYSKDAVLLVFASDYYDAHDYIRDYDAFKARSSSGVT
jgi:UDP-2-acetamido-3-amino-2,3-dideoxy-glucuronate N-acetyltransferase